MEMLQYILILRHYSEQVQEVFCLLSTVMPGEKLNLLTVNDGKLVTVSSENGGKCFLAAGEGLPVVRD